MADFIILQTSPVIEVVGSMRCNEPSTISAFSAEVLHSRSAATHSIEELQAAHWKSDGHYDWQIVELIGDHTDES